MCGCTGVTKVQSVNEQTFDALRAGVREPVYTVYFTSTKNLFSAILNTPVVLQVGSPQRPFETDLRQWINEGLKGVVFADPQEEKVFMEKAGLNEKVYA